MESVPVAVAQVLCSGRVRLFKNLDDGREFVLGFVGAGGQIGFSVVYCETYSFNAETTEQTQVCSIDRNTFLTLVREHTQLAQTVMLELGRELEESRHRLLDIALKSARERVASHLLSLVETGSPSCRSGAVALESSRQDTSRMIGLRTETLFRILTDFQEERLIRLIPRSRKIEILDYPGLERLSK
jgi:CRP/FNR family transcriptional regulator, anaerobic regulatory protein